MHTTSSGFYLVGRFFQKTQLPPGGGSSSIMIVQGAINARHRSPMDSGRALLLRAAPGLVLPLSP